MNMTCESKNFNDYLLELNEVDYSNPIICTLVNELFNPLQTEIEKAKATYEFVRDEISHTWDIQSKRVTCHASDVLTFKEGICYAKSNLLVRPVALTGNTHRFLLPAINVVRYAR